LSSRFKIIKGLLKQLPVVVEWIDETVAKYNKQLGINKAPYVFFNLDNIPKEALKNRAVRAYKKYAAVTCISGSKKPHLMIINLDYHKSIAELEDTIAHEMLHVRFPRLEHGEDFWKRLGMILMGKEYKNMRRKR